uniref:Uncharacterized protein n=1 Tax=Ditylenchus dipsaci TaxID=166011 RepID=A0A915EKQ0_9BILA
MCSEQLIKSQTGGIQPAVMVNTLIWFPATVVRLFFVIKPSLGGSNALVIHLFYCSSIFVQLVLHFLIPLSETRTVATVLVAGLFSCSQPLMVYNWLSVFLEANPLHLSGRFLISQAIGRMVGTYAFNWLTGDKMSSDSAQQSIGRLFNSVLLLLIVAYMMFIWLSTSVHRAKRQMQIIHLSGEINGAQPPSGEPKTGRTKGQYKALLENCDESNDEENENMGFVLTEGEDSGSDRSFV